MSGNSLNCDDQLLLTMLHEELPQGTSNALLDHVETCVRCQQRLADMVASSDEWKRASEVLTGSADVNGKCVSFDLPQLGEQPIAWTETMARQLLSPPSHPEMLGRLGRYDVERLIGSGGMGVVLKAFDGELNRPVAIKLLAPHLAASGPARKRFSREARAAAAVVHQHVVPIYNVETEGDLPLIVMQFVCGESLQARIDREGPLNLCEALRIGMQVADGLSAAHQQGLVHRDIKPSNILLEEDVDRALIGDFGLARAADDASLTRTGFHPGTPQYMSPEQASGQSVDARSDLFSLGSMLYTMCAGRPPFRAESSLGVMRRITESEPTPIREINPDVPEWLCGLIETLMAKSKTERFQSASEVHELLGACLSHVQQPTTDPLPLKLTSRNRLPNERDRRRFSFRSRTGALALFTVFTLAAVFIGLMQNQGSSTTQDDFIEAVRTSSPTTISQMIANGASVDVEDRTGQSALQIAALARRKEVVALLIAEGADIHHNVLQSAAEGGNPEVLDLLISKGARIDADSGAGTPLKHAAWNGQKAAVERLLKHGAHADAKEQQSGRTPLRYAVWGSGKHPREAFEIAQVLIDAGAEPDQAADDGLTPLHEAAIRDADKLLLLLIEKGADINRPVISNDAWNGMTALDIAQKHEYLALLELIRKHGGRSAKELLAGYTPSAVTQKLLDDLVMEAKSKEPQWGEAPEQKRAYLDSELRQALATSICERLAKIRAGKLDDVPQAVNELQGLHIRLQPLLTPTESSYKVASEIAASIWPVVLARTPSELNDVLVDLTRPYAAIITSDKVAEQGQPTEPLGWDVQAVHAIALARSGKPDEALSVNRALRNKIEVNLEKGRHPNQNVSFLGKDRSQSSLLQQSILQEAFILSCKGRHAQSLAVSSIAGQVAVKDSTVDDQRFVVQLVIALSKFSETQTEAEGTKTIKRENARLEKLVEDNPIVVCVTLRDAQFTGKLNSHHVEVKQFYKGNAFDVTSVFAHLAFDDDDYPLGTGKPKVQMPELKAGEYVLVLNAVPVTNSAPSISSFGLKLSVEPSFNYYIVRNGDRHAAWPVDSPEARFVTGLLVSEPPQRVDHVSAADADSASNIEKLHFQRLCQLRVAYHTRYDSIVQTIRDDATAQAAAKAYAEVMPLKCELHYLGRMLGKYELGPDQQSLLNVTEQTIDSINQRIVRATLKVKDEPYFDTFETVFNDMLVASRAMLPAPVSEGHAQRGDGPQFVVWLPPGAKGEIDLSEEVGTLEVFVVNQATGELRGQREYIACGGMALLPVTASKFGTLCWLRPVAEPSDTKADANTSPSVTWKDLLGKEPPQNYPADALSLIESLNNSRGEWIFAVHIKQEEAESEFEAAMEIQGGFKNMIRQDAFPQWQVVIAWPREEPINGLVLNVMALPESDGIKWMLAPQYASKDGGPVPGRHQMYEGSWNAETATVTWTSTQMRSPLKKDGATEEPEEPESTFEMAVKSNGEIQFRGYQHNDSLRFSGQSAARVGEPYVEEEPSIPKLPGGYKIFFASHLEVYLDSESGPLVAGPRIEKIGCEGNLIFGLISIYDNSKNRSDKPGYFWLDTNTGEIIKGMGLTPWKEALKSKGVDEPRLVAPESVGDQD